MSSAALARPVRFSSLGPYMVAGIVVLFLGAFLLVPGPESHSGRLSGILQRIFHAGKLSGLL